MRMTQLHTLFKEIQGSFVDMQGCFADIQGCFTDIQGFFVDIQGSFDREGDLRLIEKRITHLRTSCLEEM